MPCGEWICRGAFLFYIYDFLFFILPATLRNRADVFSNRKWKIENKK
jgi:hypothetical protein